MYILYLDMMMWSDCKVRLNKLYATARDDQTRVLQLQMQISGVHR